jgi:hypothetical protein
VVGKVNVFVSLNGAEISNSQFDCSIGASDSDATLSTIDDAAVSIAAGRAGRSLHSSTSLLNLSRFCH